MADQNHTILAYLEGEGRGFAQFFVIFPDWTPQDYDEVCDRIQDVLTRVGISPHGELPRLIKNGRATLGAGYRQRIAAETLLFGHYNQDNLLLLPHQKDPSKPRPLWFRDHMLIPGPRSLGQRLISVSFRRIKNKAMGRRGTQTTRTAQVGRQTHVVHDRLSSPTEPESTLTTQDATSISSAGAEEVAAAAEQPLPSNAITSVGRELTESNVRPTPFEDLTIHTGNMLELENGQIVMRRTLRDLQSWYASSDTGTFDFEKVRRSVGVPAGWVKELFFFPDVTKDPHSVLDEDELLGAIQHLYKQSAKEPRIRTISFFVAADIDHVRALSLDQRDLSKQAAQTVDICSGNH